MSEIRINGIVIENYRSFGDNVIIKFPDEKYKKPVSIVGYNNAGKTNLINAVLYGITEKYVNKDTFTINDFHNRNIKNIPKITTRIHSSQETKENGKIANLTGWHKLNINLDGSEIESATIDSYKECCQEKNWQAFGAAKYYKIFYINFHEIKKEISTKKTSWGNLTSFLAKHIKSIMAKDKKMYDKKNSFEKDIKDSTESIIKDSMLNEFIKRIQKNYAVNLKDSKCEIEFGLPEYDDIFLEMMFKVGLNGDKDNLIPIDHFGDGYISMFVMSVIQAIAESNDEDKCLFLFEEPESFLHENHQEYFYKSVLCPLSEKGHQVIYTTHSDKMLDIFDTKGLIRIEFDEKKKQTVLKYNNCSDNFISEVEVEVEVEESKDEELVSRIRDYNNYIKIIEPNLNKIIFSRKVVLVEGPNDLMVYKEIIRKKVIEISGDKKLADTYLNFNNIVVIPHHGKVTAIVLIKLCKHLGLDYFVINDFDFQDNFIEKLDYKTESEYKESNFYKKEIEDIEAFNLKGEPLSEATKKAMVTTNWKLITEAGNERIHFNIPKLESVIGYESNDKDSTGIWDIISNESKFSEDIFPEKLYDFLEFDKITKKDTYERF
ncbi:ATP-dependent endonuclease [Clostridium putrefaciens]|uniref:ATP-dependent endonuclease n=1 Tax=Clostridium putrefaciens TaxID=99675 RepID=A0A381JB93_9CLOT|nr:AAA family ATPase [Clostridium putrefaciens]SUY47667.1 ATP-dependent endonuclease [Clostridium putrefaciens]